MISRPLRKTDLVSLMAAFTSAAGWTATSDPAHLVKDINSASYPAGSYPSGLTPFGSIVVFSAFELVSGGEVWISDGTEAGTVLLKDIAPGPSHSSPFAFKEAGDELWRSDGTEEGTVLVQDISPGPRSSYASNLQVVGDPVFFVADDGETDGELWAGHSAILTNNPLRAVEDLLGRVRTQTLPEGLRRSLVAKLEAAANALEQGREEAPRLLDAFIRELEALREGILPEGTADGLIGFGREIIGLLD